MTKRGDILAEVKKLQDSMVNSAPAWCSADDLESLRGLIRLSVEARYFFDEESSAEYRDLRYQCESTFAGISTLSFQAVASIYRVSDHPALPTLALHLPLADSIKEIFLSKYQDFRSGDDFDTRCWLLLDLFRLQVIFAGINYG